MTVSLARAPGTDVAVPPAMRELADGPVTLVWQNEVGGLTGRVDGANPSFIKWNRLNSGESLHDEADRLRWLAGLHPVPEVLDYVRTADAELLVTAALPGRSAVDPLWVARPADAIRALATGLLALHSLPIDDCLFDWDVESRINAGTAAGRDIPANLRIAPPIDRLVICHGDACAPNTLLDADGRFLANVDFARLGLADRWADLAVATMSLAWNYADFDESVFWDTYGLAPDPERISYYRALYRAT